MVSRWCHAGVALGSRKLLLWSIVFLFYQIDKRHNDSHEARTTPPNISNASQCKRRTRGHRSAPAALSAVKMCASFARGAGRQGSRAPTITRQIKEYKEMTVNPKKTNARAPPRIMWHYELAHTRHPCCVSFVEKQNTKLTSANTFSAGKNISPTQSKKTRNPRPFSNSHQNCSHPIRQAW